MIKILTILGARPQFIKAGSFSRAVLDSHGVEEVIIHTGQHYDANMSDVFFDEMNIPKPSYSLGVGGTTHAVMTGEMMSKLESVIVNERPNWVLVYGDTNSTLAGALTASKLGVPIIHVEAGLRSFNMNMPEEINRILTDRISNLLFCPTNNSLKNLQDEGVENWKSARVLLVGDIMADGVKYYVELAKKPDDFHINGDYVLLTIHRAENTDSISKLKGIVSAVNKIAEETAVVLPIHPRTHKKLTEFGLEFSEQVIQLSPQGYLNMLWLVKHAACVMTDSGGLQKEAYLLGKLCITLREQTEWVELVEAGVNILVGSQSDDIYRAYLGSIKYKGSFPENIYGDGTAAYKIIETLLDISQSTN